MPLLDHFRPPVADFHRWESFHSNWATRIADALNEKLPADFMAEENTHAGGRLEIDVATYEMNGSSSHHGNGVAVAETVYAPPVPALAVPVTFPDSFEVRVYAATGGLTLVGVIELVSPANKDRPDERAAFAAKTAGFLHRGVSVVLVDVVTTRRANLHNDTLRLLAADPTSFLPDDAHLYAVAYRPVLRGERTEIDIWPHRLDLGAELPTLPLRLTGDTFVPVELDAAYTEACRRRRIG